MQFSVFIRLLSVIQFQLTNVWSNSKIPTESAYRCDDVGCSKDDVLTEGRPSGMEIIIETACLITVNVTRITPSYRKKGENGQLHKGPRFFLPVILWQAPQRTVVVVCRSTLTRDAPADESSFEFSHGQETMSKQKDGRSTRVRLSYVGWPMVVL